MTTVNTIITALVFAVCAASSGAAQTVAPPSQLSRALSAGDNVIVDRAGGSRVSGKIAEVTSSSLVVLTPERVAIAIDSISAIERRDSLWNGILIGATAGGSLAALGYATTRGKSDSVYGFAYIGSWLFPAVGATVGALIDRSHRRVIYRAPGQARRLILCPWVSRRAQGLNVAVAF